MEDEAGTPGAALAVRVDEAAPAAPVVHLEGELDANGAGAARTALQRAIEGAPAEVRVEVGALTFVDSVGLSVLVSAHKQAVGAGVSMSLCHPRPSTLRVLEITGLTSVLDVRP